MKSLMRKYLNQKLNWSTKNKEISITDKENMISFYKMLLKMKKKRPDLNVFRLMRLLYKSDFDNNLDLFE